MSTPIILQSSGIILRSTTEDDLNYVLQTEHDEQNRRFITRWTREQHIAVLGQADQAHFIVEHDNERAGYVILAGLANPNQSVELLRITLSKKEKGLGRSTLRLLQKWIFEEKKAHRLWLDVKDFNDRARHVYESVGFVAEGTLRECVKFEDGYDSLIIMSILRREYEANRNE
ncbi:GNAT family N-acetyltransferase [Brevibacillus ginsengisoli]|uniref:GNAT family N-acetyltransferase n=1 Tax=Brevibacillus ginsengisoli TaxID=363854 RepID=UPI003CE993F1